ncbi:MAG: cytochrome c3 family protein [Planctomycetota bacterium]|jgi:cytochrome b subunit of formate dehydrogenase
MYLHTTDPGCIKESRRPMTRPASTPMQMGLVLLASLLGTAPAWAQENEDCLTAGCHGNPNLSLTYDDHTVSLFVDEERFSGSIHGGLDCISCHVDLEDVDLPHEEDLERADCGDCHEPGDDPDDPIAQFWASTHGRKVEADDPDAPWCQDCHGSHYILPLADLDSAISPFNIPRMCAQCHAEGEGKDVSRTHDISQENIIQRYTQSIHGHGLFDQGLVVTAVCTSCHTGHNVLPHEDPRSTIHKDRVSDTCRVCHGLIEEVHRKRIGGELWWEKGGAAPICVECHQPHEARKVYYDTGIANLDCLSCHADPEKSTASDGRSLAVKREEYERSVHGRQGTSCAQCHRQVDPSKSRSCETITERVDCAVCHEAVVADYRISAHGTLHAKGDPNAPYCTDCHGTHETLEHAPLPNDLESDRFARASPTFARNIPALCGQCHREGAPAAVRHLGAQQEIIAHYTDSIHGSGLLDSGLTVTATCTACHTAHRELPHEDPRSSISADRIADTCGQCHDGINERYVTSIHSPQGNPDFMPTREHPKLPRCNDCHSSHTITRTDVQDFKLGIMDTCGKCHTEVGETYFDTYHGKVARGGEAITATCQDCHGAHDTRRVTDPSSRLSRRNIVTTCAECHPKAHMRFAGYLTHATHHDPQRYAALYYAFWGMTFLLIGTFGLFGLHVMVWFPRAVKMRRELRELAHKVDPTDKQFVRFKPFSRKLHFTVIISFFGLAITGMCLKFSYMPWAKVVARILGGYESAGFIHRLCAVVTFGYFFVHLWDLARRFSRSNKTFWQWLLGPNTMLPTWTDAREFVGTIKWFLGKGPRPKYGRWTYWEKFDYFAVFWGVTIIGATGLILWFPVTFTRILPGWFINVATIIHSDEALLATGFIFTIHFFNTHFRPDKFPMDPVIFTGRMSLAEFKEDRPRDYRELVARGELDDRLADPIPLYLTRGVKVFGYTALVIGLTLVVLIIYSMISYR